MPRKTVENNKTTKKYHFNFIFQALFFAADFYRFMLIEIFDKLQELPLIIEPSKGGAKRFRSNGKKATF